MRSVACGSIAAPVARPMRLLGLAGMTIFGVLLLTSLLLLTPSRAEDPAALDEPAGPGRLQEQIDAGEFAPALRAATALPRGKARDEVLAQMAGAQARAGTTRNAYLTASQVDDDSLRARTFAEAGRVAPLGAAGGSMADFDALIDLITATIAPTTWDAVGGPGSVQGFEGGVYCDPDGTLVRLVREEGSGRLADIGGRARWNAAAVSGAASTQSPLRKISLSRLEKHVERSLAEGRPLSAEMRNLAGMYRIQYVLVYPDERDIVLAGPAGDWKEDAEGRRVNVETNQPVVQLDDLVVIFRHMLSSDGGRFGCSITPTKDGLARTKAFVEESNKTPLKPGQRDSWLKRLRDSLGYQEIEVYGIDPRTRAARVLVEADYRMKLVGMGLEDGVLGVRSYLDSIALKPGEVAPPMDVLRWWFTLNYKAVLASSERDVYEIRGQGVQVLSENELLTLTGQRVHTGAASPANQAFTSSFTEHFDRLAAKYPVYADLRNIFDLAIVGALLKAEQLHERADWKMPLFGDAERYVVPLSTAPKQVQTVIAHRVFNRTQIVVGVSGGVSVNAAAHVAPEKIESDTYGKLKAERTRAAAKELALGAWWWD
jgi:hypothetical protein